MVSVPWPAAASLLAAGGTVLLAAHLWRYRDKPGADWFLASLASQTVMSLAYGVGLLVFDPQVRWALEVVVWAALTGTGVYFLVSATAYTGRGHLLERYHGAAAVSPAVVAVVVATNPLHRVAWTGFALDPVAGMATVSYAVQPWTAALMTAGVLAVVVGSLLLFDTVVSYGPLYRREAVAVGLSTIPPLAALLVWLYRLGPVEGLNLTTTMFLPHVALDAYAFVGSDMFEFHPATRRTGERAAIDDLGAPVVIVDERRRVVTLNDAAQSGFGVAKADALTRPLADVLAECGAREPDRDLTDGGTVTLTRAGGRTVYAVTTTQLTDASGTHVGYTVVFQDVTDRRQREQRLNVLNRVLRHNLRNDITVVKGFTEAAAGRVDDEETASMLARAAGTADDLAALGETAREIERVLARDGTPRTVALATLLAEVADDHADGAPEATVTVDAGDVTAETDPDVLGVVVGELLENALEHAGPAPTVELAARRRDGAVAVTVTDDGPGLPEHELSVVETGAESPLEHGSGLGLWLANWGAATLGGELTVASDDTGTTATVLLPDDDRTGQLGDENGRSGDGTGV